MAELKTLRLEQSGFRHAIKKSFRVIKHKASLKEKQALLEKYQQVLDTRILLRLDSHSLREMQSFHTLDHDVQQLAVALEQGHRTLAQLLANQGQELKEHIDKGFEKQAQAIAANVAHQQLLESLFFPEIVSRQEQISEAYQGTYQWIFDPPTSERVRNVRSSNFHDWLETGDGIYWISGKPGSGKSTLMKFIVREHQTLQLLENWKKNGRLLIISFFFWRPGSDLQKSATGLLRSLLYQIARQWPDLIDHLDVRDRKTAGDVNVPINLRHLLAWTDQRLLYVLKCFLDWKPTSLWICALIDGLDEFIGEEELLLDVIRIFDSAPRCKVCVSSRPEQTLRQEFQMCSQLRVQDVNRDDMKRTVAGKLSPHLKKYPVLPKRHFTLEENILRKAEGVFLWLDLMIKILVRGAKNEDSYETLLFRLEKTPDTINGMYSYIWESLDSVYEEESLRYFHVLLAAQDLGVTLLLTDLVCAAGEPRERVIQFDRDYFVSEQFDLACRHEETRLVACCGGFIEIKEDSSEEAREEEEEEEEESERDVESTKEEESEDEELKDGAVIPCRNKRVAFVHRTAFDFIRDRHDGPQFYSSSSYKNANFRLSIGRISQIVLFSLTHTRSELYRSEVLGILFQDIMYLTCKTENLAADGISKDSERFGSLQADLTHQVFQSVTQSYNSFHRPKQNPFADIPFVRRLIQPYDEKHVRDSSFMRWCPVSDRLSAAAHFGCYNYLQSRLSTESNVDEHVPNLLQCVISGSLLHAYGYMHCRPQSFITRLLIIQMLLQHNFDPNMLLTTTHSSETVHDEDTLWGAIFAVMMLSYSMVKTAFSDFEWLTWQSCTVDIVERLLDSGKNPNTRTSVRLSCENPNRRVSIFVKASPLALVEFPYMYSEYPLTRIQASLRSAGAVNRKELLYLSSHLSSAPVCHYRLSGIQSQRLDEIIPSGQVHVDIFSLNCWRIALDANGIQMLEDIMDNFSNEDAIDEQTMLNEIRSFPESS